MTLSVPFHDSAQPPRAVVTTDDDGVVIRLTGEIDRFTAVPLFAELHTVVVGNPARHLVVDLGGVEFCDVGAIRCLVDLTATADRHGSTLRVRAVRPDVGWLIDVLGVADRLRRGSAHP